jgi:hypothetical protein
MMSDAYLIDCGESREASMRVRVRVGEIALVVTRVQTAIDR